MNRQCFSSRRVMDPQAAALIVFLFGILIFFLRLHTFNEPLERDLTLYAVFGNELNHGKKLYSDLWDQKPPAIYVTYSLAQKLVGYGPQAVFLLNITTAVGTLILMYLLGAHLGKRRLAGVCVALVWTLLCGDPYLQANQPNSEAFINLFLTGFIAVLLFKKKSPTWDIVAGLLAACATFYKHTVVLTVVILSVALLLVVSRPDRYLAGKRVLRIFLVIAVLWIFLVAYFWNTGRLANFFATLVTYNLFYANPINPTVAGLVRSQWSHVSALIHFSVLRPFFIFYFGSALGVCVASLVIGFRQKERREIGFLGAWIIAGLIATVLPGFLFGHYFQFLLPPLCLGLGIALVPRREEEMSRTRYRWLLCVIVGSILMLYELSFYRYSAREWSVLKYGSLVGATQEMGHALEELVRSDQTFYNWGNEPQLYFYSHRRPPTGILMLAHLTSGPFAARNTERVISDLEKSKPALIVLTRRYLSEEAEAKPLMRWLEDHYAASSDASFGPFEVWRPRAGIEQQKAQKRL